MRDSDKIGFIGLAALLVLAFYAFLAVIAGNIVNEIFAPFPSISGPIGAAVALALFIFLLIKTGEFLGK